ncbi:3083_t:CDS:2 [Acaulospora morrowiae]|uniref:3083_t:CDS:1 n=1 Tax=Acaulospora morrowiae TaxID=94023 RepID=A0A9N9G6X5_9GLOM|nr:3083_t:CDS:2 [Acaulospora morrowiae]
MLQTSALAANFYDILVLLIFSLLTYILYFYICYFTRSSPLPGPIPLPIIGNVFSYPGDADKWAQQLQKKYGDIYEIYLGSARTVWLNRSDLVQKIMSTSSENHFRFRTIEHDGMNDLGMTTKGLFFNRIEEDALYHRKFFAKTIMTPQMGKDAVDFMQVAFNEMEFFLKDYGCFDESTEIDFAGWMHRLMFEIIIKLTTTSRVYALTNYYNSLNPSKKTLVPENEFLNTEKFVNSIKKFFDSWVFFLFTIKIMRGIPGIRRTRKKLLEEKNWYYKSVLEIVKMRRGQIEQSDRDSLSKDMLTQFLTVNTTKDVTKGISDEHYRESMSDEAIAGNMIEILGGGTVTTSNTICYIIHHVAHYPEVQQRIRQELDDVLGTDRDSKITFEDLNKLKYCEAVINEVSRIWPTVPINLRASTKPDVIGNHKFPANTQFVINQRGIHLHHQNWNNPLEFNPSRFLTDGESKVHKNAFLMFGGGVKKCPGRNLAMVEMKTMMALIYRKYDIVLVNHESIKYHYAFVRQCDEMKVKVRQRSA